MKLIHNKKIMLTDSPDGVKCLIMYPCVVID